MIVEKIAVALRPNSDGSNYYAFKKMCGNVGFEVRILDSSAEQIGQKGDEFEFLREWCDIFVSIGGDGTLISLLRRILPHKKPVLGINIGHLGFLTAFDFKEIELFLPKLKNGDFNIVSQMPLEAEFQTGNNIKRVFCINEFLIGKKDIAGMIKINSKINGKHFNTYSSDGLIIGTPVGSSAYNISAGGSIIYPYSRNILLTPVCAHSLTQKPLVLNDEFELEFSLQNGLANLVIDGQDVFLFKQDSNFKVKACTVDSLLIYDKNRDYFEVLREKFSWGI